MFSCKNFKITPKEKERKVLISDQHWQSTICNSGARYVEAAMIHICSRTRRATKHTHETACCYHNDNFTLDHDIRTRPNTLTFACLFAPNMHLQTWSVKGIHRLKAWSPRLALPLQNLVAAYARTTTSTSAFVETSRLCHRTMQKPGRGCPTRLRERFELCRPVVEELPVEVGVAVGAGHERFEDFRWPGYRMHKAMSTILYVHVCSPLNH